jgi:pimeloyl-ACP methyl ester carboxylesterase
LQRAFLTIGDRQLHYRAGGDGAPVVMLHPSPLSSAAVLPMGRALARHFRVYAFDTPGYGQSEPPASRPASLDDYLPGFAAALDALGLGRICLYGAATGAQFAVEFARRYPERIALVVLDSAGHIGAEECERVVHDYFPDVAPRGDGSHLATLWQMVHDLGVFFPWCDRREERRIARDLAPPEAMQSMLVDYLRAGEGYDWAYRPAFYNERAERAQGVTVPAVLMRWEGSVVLRITDELIAAGLPPNYHVLPLGPTMPERIDGLVSHLVATYRAPTAPAAPESPLPRGRFVSRYVDLPGGQLHLRLREPAGHAAGTAPHWCVALMGPAGAASLLEAQARHWPGDKTIALLDLPGSGDSDALLAPDATPAQHAAVAAEALRALGATQADLLGWRGGAGVAIELARLRPALVRSLTLDRAGLPDAASRADALAHEPREFVPRLDGTHLLAAWAVLRDRRLWKPGYRPERRGILAGEPDLDPRSIQRELLALMKQGARYAPARTAELQHAADTVLGQLPCPIAYLAAGETPRWSMPLP